MCGTAIASKGAWRATSADASISLCVTSAPIRSTEPCNETPFSASMPFRSISSAGSDRRMFKVASSVCPPASSRASSPYSASNENTASSERGFV
jgi:hypothetical protein